MSSFFVGACLLRHEATRRLKELGIRLALGAGRMEIFLRSVGRSLALVAIGVSLGSALGPLLFGKVAETPIQASLIAVCGGVLILVGSIAAARPGMHALRTNPVDVLRHE
jgi:ABC-type antimicrobial peptide transport system permease subunit